MKKKKIKSLSERNPINMALARKVVAIVSKGLTDGLGDPVPGKMCVEAAVCFALGQPHGDQPKCVHGDVSEYKIELNDDGVYKGEKDRAKQLTRIAVAQLGSRKMVGDFGKCLAFAYNIRFAIPRLKRMVTEQSPLINIAIIAQAIRLIESGQIYDAYELMEEAVRECTTIDDNPVWSLLTALDIIHHEGTKAAIEVGIDALRRAGSPGVALMDKLIAEGAI